MCDLRLASTSKASRASGARAITSLSCVTESTTPARPASWASDRNSCALPESQASGKLVAKIALATGPRTAPHASVSAGRSRCSTASSRSRNHTTASACRLHQRPFSSLRSAMSAMPPSLRAHSRIRSNNFSALLLMPSSSHVDRTPFWRAPSAIRNAPAAPDEGRNRDERVRTNGDGLRRATGVQRIVRVANSQLGNGSSGRSQSFSCSCAAAIPCAPCSSRSSSACRRRDRFTAMAASWPGPTRAFRGVHPKVRRRQRSKALPGGRACRAEDSMRGSQMTTARLELLGTTPNTSQASSQASLEAAMVQTCPGARLPRGRPALPSSGTTFGSSSAWNSSANQTRTCEPKETRTSRAPPSGVSPSSAYAAEASITSESRRSSFRRSSSSLRDHPPNTAARTAAISVTQSVQPIPTSKQKPSPLHR